MLFKLKFSGKTSEKYAASLGTKAKQIYFLDICDYLKKYFVVVVVDSSANITLAVSSWCFFELCFL